MTVVCASLSTDGAVSTLTRRSCFSVLTRYTQRRSARDRLMAETLGRS